MLCRSKTALSTAWTLGNVSGCFVFFFFTHGDLTKDALSDADPDHFSVLFIMNSSISLSVFFFIMVARALGHTRGVMFVVVWFLFKQTAGVFPGSPLMTETYLSTGTVDSEKSADIPTASGAVSSEGTASLGYITSKISELHPSFSENESHTGKNHQHGCPTM